MAIRCRDEGPTTSLLSDPLRGQYRNVLGFLIGEPVAWPEPFGVELPTDQFLETTRTRTVAREAPAGRSVRVSAGEGMPTADQSLARRPTAG